MIDSDKLDEKIKELCQKDECLYRPGWCYCPDTWGYENHERCWERQKIKAIEVIKEEKQAK